MTNFQWHTLRPVTDTSDPTAPHTDNGTPSSNRRLVGILGALLAAVGAGVFVAPFAFPIRPPVVQGIRSTVLFSPSAEGSRSTASISFKMNEAGAASVTVSDPSDRGGTVRRVVREGDAPAGRISVTWDGRDEQGAVLPDGRYILNIRANAGRRSWNSNRPIYIDTSPPEVSDLTVRSAIAYGSRGACQVSVTVADPGTLALSATAPRSTAVLARRDEAQVSRGTTVRWSWDGTRRGRRVSPGLYVIRATTTDRLRNVGQTIGTCWVSHGGGASVPAVPARGARVGVRLSDRAGRAVAASTPTRVWLARRKGDLGGTSLDVVGRRIGSVAQGRLDRVRVVLPRRRSLGDLWLVAETSEQQVVIPLRP